MDGRLGFKHMDEPRVVGLLGEPTQVVNHLCLPRGKHELISGRAGGHHRPREDVEQMSNK
jgi:hypothetical protein